MRYSRRESEAKIADLLTACGDKETQVEAYRQFLGEEPDFTPSSLFYELDKDRAG